MQYCEYCGRLITTSLMCQCGYKDFYNKKEQIFLCPNCNGQKIVSKPPWVAGDIDTWIDSGTPSYPCPTCDGKGYIIEES